MSRPHDDEEGPSTGVPASGVSMIERTWPIVVRRARPEDRDAVLTFATATFDGWDYIPEVWEDWLVAGDGIFLVACVGSPAAGSEPAGREPRHAADREPRDAEGRPLPVGLPVAITRLARPSASEGWVEGIRVDPRVRGMSIATDLQVAELRWAAAHGMRVIRYATGQSNVGSQRLGARHGFRVTGRWQRYGQDDYEAPGDADERRERVMHALETLARDGVVGTPGSGGSQSSTAEAGAWQWLSGDATFAAGNRLYECRHWCFCELTAELFEERARQGEVLVEDDGATRALALIDRQASLRDGALTVRVLSGDGGAAVRLLERVRELGIAPAQVWLPDPDPPLLRGHEEAFAAAGYPPSRGRILMLERPMDAAHPVPAVDPSRLLLAEEPVELVRPPSAG